ncbi:MXAN_6640 family putative metalloprotease [Candidatus Neomarinimicrobiota bacterium]
MQKSKVFLILFIIAGSFTFSDSKSIVTQSADRVIDVLEGKSFVRHMTPFLLDIARNGHLLSEENKGQLKSLGFDFSGNLVVLLRPNLNYYYDTEHFRIHYDLTGTNAVDNTITNENNIPDYIDTIANVFEEVYDHEINFLGYTAPPSDGTDGGGSNKYDIYVKSTNAYGWTDWGTLLGDNPNSTNVTENNAYTSYITMRNNYIGFPNTELENIQVTAGHEFFHAIQFGYEGEEETWLYESTATWMEEETYDDVNDCYQYMIPWFEKPHTSLNSESGLHRYGSYIFFKYIDEHLGGPEIIKKTWEQSRLFDSTQNDFSILSIDEALKSKNHTFKKVLNNMAIANIIFSSDEEAGQYSYEEAIGYQDYREESYYDTLAIQLGIYNSIDFINGIPNNIESYNLQQYGSQYIKVNAADPVKVSINTPDLTLHTVVKSNSGNYEVQSGNILNIDPGSNSEWIYAVVVADDDNGTDFNYNLSFTDGIKTNYTDFTILGQFPNPFNSSITIKLKVITPQDIDLVVYDMLGRKITTIFSGYLSDGSYEYLWNGLNASNETVSSGVYYITAVSDNRQEWKKITLVK